MKRNGYDETTESWVLRHLDAREGTSVAQLQCAMTPGRASQAAIGAALQRLKKKGLAECAHGYMGWSWFSVPVSPSGATHE